VWAPTKVVVGSTTYYYFTNKRSGLVFDVKGNSQSAGATLQTSAYTGSDGQLFSVVPATAAGVYGSVAGTTVPLTPGSYTQSQLTALGISPTASQLIQVLDGYQAIAYTGDNFTGTATAVGYDAAGTSVMFPLPEYDAAGQSVSNIKSLKIVEAPTAAVTYEAEWQVMLGSVTSTSKSAASRAAVVGLTASGQGVQINNVQASRHISLRYHTAGATGTLSVYVNGIDVGTITCTQYNQAEKYWPTLGDDFSIPEGATVQIKRDSGDTSTPGVWLDTVRFSY
jgi:hypothetical protein